MADYDLSKPAPDRSRKSARTGGGGLGFYLAGCVIVLVVVYAIFGGAGVPEQASDAPVAQPEAAQPLSAVD